MPPLMCDLQAKRHIAYNTIGIDTFPMNRYLSNSKKQILRFGSCKIIKSGPKVEIGLKEWMPTLMCDLQAKRHIAHYTIRIDTFPTSLYLSKSEQQILRFGSCKIIKNGPKVEIGLKEWMPTLMCDLQAKRHIVHYTVLINTFPMSLYSSKSELQILRF